MAIMATAQLGNWWCAVPIHVQNLQPELLRHCLQSVTGLVELFPGRRCMMHFAIWVCLFSFVEFIVRSVADCVFHEMSMTPKWHFVLQSTSQKLFASAVAVLFLQPCRFPNMPLTQKTFSGRDYADPCPYACVYCGRRFKTVQGRAGHWRLQHGQPSEPDPGQVIETVLGNHPGADVGLTYDDWTLGRSRTWRQWTTKMRKKGNRLTVPRGARMVRSR